MPGETQVSAALAILHDGLRGKPFPSVSEIAAKHADPYRVLVATIISLRTKDEVTLAAAERLFVRAPDLVLLDKLSEKELALLIYPAGFYRTKAANMKKIARILLKDFDGRVPDNLEELLALPGVGRKTANLVLNLSFNKGGICVDTHVHRISNRLGWVSTRTPWESEQELEKIVPHSEWISINEILVKFGQTVCLPLSPHCTTCLLGAACQRVGVTRFR